MSIHELAGTTPGESLLVDLAKLEAAYYQGTPDAREPSQRVSFGTSGHRGSSFQNSFNEIHILAITQAICNYRARQGTTGPLFIGKDTHALSAPALRTALEVLAANAVEAMISQGTEYTPTPAISHSILTFNRGRDSGFADGIVITPSHNPPQDGGFKYNPPDGGPAQSEATSAIEKEANALLESGLAGVKRIPYEQAFKALTTHKHDYVRAYVDDLAAVLDFDAIRGGGMKLGVDPLGGAGVDYWAPIAEKYGLDLSIVNTSVDGTFRFMSIDWDGKIRMDPSSRYAMRGLIDLKDRFDVAFACDPDHDRHGIVTRGSGLLQPNHYLAACVYYLFQNRPAWGSGTAIGKTLVSSDIDRPRGCQVRPPPL